MGAHLRSMLGHNLSGVIQRNNDYVLRRVIAEEDKKIRDKRKEEKEKRHGQTKERDRR
ncbi:MAG: hypothetical protein NTV62_03405 [Candidatus Gribaldobacteria bacterium]|nr:hypothetical protein [Candidatus Gribaldobacteria bacterium]